MKEIKVFSPASVSNICCGFDVLGFAMEDLGDIISLKKIDRKGVFIKNTSGFNIPLDVKKNTATVALLAFLDKLNCLHGFEVSIEKNIKPGSGLGSSAASAAGSVYAANMILGKPFTLQQLVELAMQGELITSRSAPADNIASALFGGIPGAGSTTGTVANIKSNGTYSGSATATGSFGAMHVAQNTYDRV